MQKALVALRARVVRIARVPVETDRRPDKRNLERSQDHDQDNQHQNRQVPGIPILRIQDPQVLILQRFRKFALLDTPQAALLAVLLFQDEIGMRPELF